MKLKKTAKTFFVVYRSPIFVLAILAAAVALDTSFHSFDADAYNQGNRQLAAGKNQSAIRQFSRMLRLNPTDAKARLGLAQAYQANGWYEESSKQYEMAIESATETLKLSNEGLDSLTKKAEIKPS